MPKKGRTIRNNFYYGSVLQKKVNISERGTTTEVVCLYNTIAYKDSNNFYYDFISEQQLEAFSYNKLKNLEIDKLYFLKERKYFFNPNYKHIRKSEKVTLFDDICALSLLSKTEENLTRKKEIK